MSWEKDRIYIAVKTYPTISDKYAELVCTAGVREDGSWIRLYPMPFRLLKEKQKYKKYTWIEVEVERNNSDFRPESFRPDLESVTTLEDSKKIDWDERRKILFKNKKIYTNLEDLIGRAHNKDNPISLAMFKPTKITEFVYESVAREWDEKKIQHLWEESQQYSLFKTPEEVKADFRVVQKVPYKFSYRFEDDAGKTAKLMIEDWEIGMLFLNCLKYAHGNEDIAIAKVKEKYMKIAEETDIYFILGTTLKNHYVSKNPFIIVGVFRPPFPSGYQQMTLFD